MKRPMGYACLFFILLIRLFYICFPPSLPDYSAWKGREVYVRGRVISKQIQEFHQEKQILFMLENVHLQEENTSTKDKSETVYVHDNIRCYSSENNLKLHIGSEVWVKGLFMPFEAAQNPGQFDAQFYFHMQDIGGCLEECQIVWSDFYINPWQAFLYTIKNSLSEKIDTNFEPRYAGLMKTILLGDKSDLDGELKNLYKESGILHILTISGMHISMLGMGCFQLLRKAGISQKISAAAGLLAVLFYGAFIGTQAATFRAICMFTMQMTAILIGRTYDRMTGLSVAAMLLLLEQPMYVFYSGFLLSFGAVLGMTVIVPIIEKLGREQCLITKWLFKIFSGSIEILLATLPIQLYFYYEYPIYSMFINVLVLPFLPYIVGFGVLVLALPVKLSGAAVPFVTACEGILYGYEWICERSRGLPYHAVVLGAPKGWQIVLYYGCLIGFLWWLEKKEPQTENSKIWKHLGILPGCFLVSMTLLLYRCHHGLSCHFLSVGQGDCTVIRYEEKTYIVDGGSTSNLNIGTEIILPCLKYYGISEVEGIFISHADADHMNGILQWLTEYEHSHVKIGRIILPSLEQEALEQEFLDLLEMASQYDIPVSVLGAGDILDMGRLGIYVLHPGKYSSSIENSNAYSQVLLFAFDGQGVLMTGDIGAEEEKKVLTALDNLAEETKVTVLKVPHHGSKYSSSEEFLEYLHPDNAILSYGLGNSYGHPHTAVLERLEEIHTNIYKTTESGMVTVRMEGGKVKMAEYAE